MAYTITGSVTFSSQTNRDAALSRVNTAITGLAWAGVATALPSGINTSGTTVLTISLLVTEDDSTVASSLAKTILDALVSTNRHTSGYLAVNKT